MIEISGHTQVCAVIGSPVRHSLSPLLHNTAFAELGIDWRYVAFEIAPGDGPAALEAMRALGIRGLSVTMPHKDDAARCVDRPSPAVVQLGACNTVVLADDGALEGHNTDGDGLLDSFAAETGESLGDLRVMVLGAGGSARAICEALGRAGSPEIVVVNRTAERAATTAALAGRNGRVGTVADAAGVDVVINATNVGMGDRPGETPIDSSLLLPRHAVIDIVYKPLRTALLIGAAERGARTLDGVGMLIHQAGRQNRLWTGYEPPIGAMTAIARAHLASVS